MKNLNKLIVFLLIIISMASCGAEAISDPEEIGLKAFEMLHSIKSLPKEKYLESFLTIEDYRELTKNDPKMHDVAMNTAKIDWDSRQEASYNESLIRANIWDVELSEIKFYDYTYEVDANKCVGKLYFTYGSKTYIVVVLSLIIDGKYYLYDIDVDRRA